MQEPGIRQSCAIPYEVYSDAQLSGDRKNIEVQMRAGNQVFGNRAVGSPFNVYLYGTKKSSATTAKNQSQPNMMAATYAVRAGDTLKESVPLSSYAEEKYVVAVHGPNGFFREFAGDKNDPGLEIACTYQTSKSSGSGLTGNIELHIKSKDGKTYAVEVTDNSYMGSPIRKSISPRDSASVTMDLGKQYGWYDFSIKVPEFGAFERRYAGHVDTGESSYTDPLMGGILHTT